MAEFLGLLIGLVFLAFVLLPVLSFVRLGRLSSELEDLRKRVRDLERAPGSAEPTAAAAPAPVAPPVPQAPIASPALLAPADSRLEPEPREVLAGPLALDEEPDLEERIAGRGLLYTGILVLLFGVSFFLKYAFDNAWINETGRVVLGALAGTALVVAGLRLTGHGLAAFGQALAGGGFAILYLAIYAALSFYDLIGPNAAFGGMALVTLIAAAVADRERAQTLAVIAVGGGFLTPFLVGGDDQTQLRLFTYDALLVTGTMVLALRHRWLGLNALSYVLTAVTVLAWVDSFYTDDQWLRTLLFLTLFCVLFLIILRETRRTPDGVPGAASALGWPDGVPGAASALGWRDGVTARMVSGLLSTGPLFYHIAAVIITAGHPPAIHIYLITFAAVGLLLTAEPHRPWLRLLVLLGGFAPLLGTLTLPDGLSWLTPNVVTILAVAALHTMGLLDRVVRQNVRLHPADLLTMHLTGLGLFALLYEALQPAYPELRGVLAALIAFGAFALWQWLLSRDRVASLNAAGLAFTLGAIAIAVQFDGSASVIGWAAEGAAVAWVGLRAPSLSFQYGGLLLWGMAALRLSDRYFETPASFTPVINARSLSTFFVVVLAYVLAQMFQRHAPADSGRTRAALHVAGSALTLMWITAEIQSFWDVRYQSAQAFLYEQMLLSLAWGIYGALLVLVGMRRRYPPGRYIGIVIILATALKVFFYDFWQLGGIYRVIGFVGVGALLLLVSYLYQRRRVIKGRSAASSHIGDQRSVKAK